MKLFISYARVDIPFCKKLVTLLEAHEVWYDQNLVGGQRWWQTILDKIDWCEGFLYLLSPEAVQSEHCQKECKIALASGRIVIPILIQDRTVIPETLEHLQYVNLSKGYDQIEGLIQLMNALFEAERKSRSSEAIMSIDQLSLDDNEPPKIDKDIIVKNNQLPYNYVFRLNQRGVSQRTKEIYYWRICEFLRVIADEPNVSPQDRENYLSSISISLLQESLSVAQVKAWLGMLIADKREVGQAKSAITTLASLLAEDQIIEENLVYKLKNIDISGFNHNERPKQLLKRYEIDILINEIEKEHTGMALRDRVIASLFFVLRSGEVADTRWKNVHAILGTTYYKRGDTTIQLPQITSKALERWYKYLLEVNHVTTVESVKYPLFEDHCLRQLEQQKQPVAS